MALVIDKSFIKHSDFQKLKTKSEKIVYISAQNIYQQEYNNEFASEGQLWTHSNVHVYDKSKSDNYFPVKREQNHWLCLSPPPSYLISSSETSKLKKGEAHSKSILILWKDFAQWRDIAEGQSCYLCKDHILQQLKTFQYF